MKTIELLGHVDDQHRLCIQVPESVRPGPVRVIVEFSSSADHEDAARWTKGVARAWAADWSDPREDIYSLEDGAPADESR
jgi:hypothetical protein